MTVDTFLDWQAVQDIRCELIDGRPVAMTGASFARDIVVGNLRSTLKTHLRAAGSPCRSFGADIGVVVSPTTLRRPDVAVYCPPYDYSAATSDRPRLIAEVLSRSTEHVDYVDLKDLGISVAVRDIYDGVRLMPPDGPRLVWPTPPSER